MSQRTGKCTNFGNCTIADSAKISSIAGEAESVCPECGGRLIEVDSGGKSSKALMGFLVLVILGALGYFGFSFLKSNKPPVVVIKQPLVGQSFSSDEQVIVEADATDPDGSVKQVEFFLDGASAGPAATQAPFRLALKEVAPGTRTLKIVGTDNKGAQSEAVTLSFVVQAKAPPPAPVIPAPQPKPSVPKETALRLQGSNTIGAKLAPALAEELLKREGALEVKRVVGSSDEEVSLEGTFGGNRPAKVIEIKAHGSGTAFTGLEKGTCDIGMASRQIKAAEAEKIRNAGLGDMTSPSSEHVLALDGIAVIVHRSNPVQALTVDQLSRVFSGEFRDWKDVGGKGGIIQIYARDDKSGTYDTFKSLVLRDKSLVSSARRYEDSNQLSDDVAADPQGIGFIGLPYIRSAKALELGEKGATPSLPTTFTVSREDYPLSRRLFLYTPEAPKNPWIFKFIEFSLSDSGQEMARKLGFVGQVVTVEERKSQDVSVSSATASLDPLEKLKQGAVQVSTNFRFRTGSDQLDNRALRDLDRVVKLLSEPETKGKGLLLLGFADSRGSEQHNVLLSRSRALTVSEELKKRGITAKTVEGFGSRNPVASNDTEDGREKNRRVEAWLELKK